MNTTEKRCTQYALCREMLQTGDIVSRIDAAAIQAFASKVSNPAVLLTGEGSSRIFPANRASVMRGPWGTRGRF